MFLKELESFKVWLSFTHSHTYSHINSSKLPSIVPTISFIHLSLRVTRVSEQIPADIRHETDQPHSVTGLTHGLRQPFTLTVTSMENLPVNLTYMSLDGGKGGPTTHTDMGRPCKLHTKRPQLASRFKTRTSLLWVLTTVKMLSGNLKLPSRSIIQFLYYDFETMKALYLYNSWW